MTAESAGFDPVHTGTMRFEALAPPAPRVPRRAGTGVALDPFGAQVLAAPRLVGPVHGAAAAIATVILGLGLGGLGLTALLDLPYPAIAP